MVAVRKAQADQMETIGSKHPERTCMTDEIALYVDET